MRKLHTTSLVDFIKRALEMGFGDQPEQAPDARKPDASDPQMVPSHSSV
jgi:hypothetical protein